MSDVATLAEGSIRVRYSYGGPLKEDKKGEGKLKWAPAPDDATEFLAIWIKRRRLQGAKDEDLLFPAPASPNSPRRSNWEGFRKEHIEKCWERAAVACGVEMTWYQATRHSFVSRNLKAGTSLDEVSRAVGHSSPVVTKKFYDHFIRTKFSGGVTARLKPGGTP